MQRAYLALIDRDSLDLAWLAPDVCSRPGRLEFRSSTPKPRLDISFRGAYLLEVVAVFCLLFVGDFGFRDVTFDVEAVTFRSRSDRDKLDTVEELKAVMFCYPLHSKGDW